jgi:hypothetical protein
MRRNRSCVWCVFLSLVVFSILGCGPSGIALYPVRGSVHFEGQPAEGATVILDPVAGGEFKPSGTVAADGSFVVTTHPHGNGAPVGEYHVIITWYPEDARQSDRPKNKLPAKYGDSAKTPVPKVTVSTGSTDIPPIKLTAK